MATTHKKSKQMKKAVFRAMGIPEVPVLGRIKSAALFTPAELLESTKVAVIGPESTPTLPSPAFWLPRGVNVESVDPSELEMPKERSKSKKSQVSSDVSSVVVDLTDFLPFGGSAETLLPYLENRLYAAGREAALSRAKRILVATWDGGLPPSVESTALDGAVRGFCKSLARELGPRGVGVNHLAMCGPSDGSLLCESSSLPGAFLLSKASSYVSGETVAVQSAKPWSLAGEQNDSFEAGPVVLESAPLQSRTALVTGGCRGIGEAICARLRHQGAFVIAADVPDVVDDWTSRWSSSMSTAPANVAIPLDVASPDFVSQAHSTILSVLHDQTTSNNSPGVDILVHNAGVTRDRKLANMTSSELDSVLSVNLAPLLRSATSSPSLVRPGGSVLLLSSIVGLGGGVGQTHYSATKRALAQLTPFLAQHQNVRFNAIAPGFIESKMTDKIPFLQRLVASRMTAFSQGGTPDDVAAAAAFLACAPGVNGQLLRVCGAHFLGQ